MFKEIDGRSLLPMIEAGSGDEGRVICGEYGRDHGTAFATDGAFKYIYYAGGGVEHLFDVVNDPEDLTNLARDAQYEAVKSELKVALIRYLEGFDRPMVQDGQLVAYEVEIDEPTLRGRNPAAWRGPMRYGQGYGGGWS